MTQKERLRIYERFFHQMQMHLDITMNDHKVREALAIIGGWSYAHRRGNGEFTEAQQQKLINKWTKKMEDFV